MKQNSGKQTLAYTDLSGSECTKRKQSDLLAVHDQSRAQSAQQCYSQARVRSAHEGVLSAPSCAERTLMWVQWVHENSAHEGELST